MNVFSPVAPEIDPGTLSGYRGRDDVHDEMVDGDAVLRRHWQTFSHCLDELGLREFTERWHESLALIREHGVTYNVYGDPRGYDRPWQLDPIPLLLSEADASALQPALVQRARLLEAILADLYGPQTLLQDSLIPAELVFANPGFLRPCHGLAPPGNRFLHLVAFDLGRTPDGRFMVLSNRTQAPSGAGYALENRIVLARMLPEVFRLCKVQRLAMFFRTFRDTLRSLAPHKRDNPRTVLLTPGPFNETYFEHAYLARYLGFTLAEGGDLTVRDNRVYLKLLDGLQPVDIVWRRLDDDYCDPLELRGDSFLGIPGLVQAARAGNVVVANALGSGLVESPAFQPYLPRICRYLLAEELLLPSVPTFWCGDPQARQHVLANLDRMVIKASFRSARLDPIFGDKLSRQEREQLAQRLEARPWDFAGQEIAHLSTAPVLSDTGIEPRHLVLRTYLSAANPVGFEMMPGGLTRFTSTDQSYVVSMQKGGGSKDTWVLTDGPVNEFSLLRPQGRAVVLNRGGNDLPSRAADNLYWLGRYVERAEGMTRLLRCILVRLTEKSGLTEVPELPYLLRALTHLTQTLPGFLGDGAEQRLHNPEIELVSIIFDSDRVGTLAYNFNSIYRAASSVRDRISMDMWRVLRNLHQGPARPYDPADPPTLSDLLDKLNDHVITLAGFGGIAMESMTRGHGWRFLDMGRKIERSLQSIMLLRKTVVTVVPHEGPLLEAILEIFDSSLTYRRRYLGSMQAAPTLDLLLADENNPRSLVFQLLALRQVVEELPHDDALAGRSAEQRLALAMLTQVQLADIHRLASVHGFNERIHLNEFLRRLETDFPQLSDAIAHHYLAHLQKSRPLAQDP